MTYIYAKSRQLHLSLCRPALPSTTAISEIPLPVISTRLAKIGADRLHELKLFAAVTQSTYQRRALQLASMHSFMGRKLFSVNTFSFHSQIFDLAEPLSVLMDSEQGRAAAEAAVR